MSKTTQARAQRKTPEARAAEITAAAQDLAREQGLSAVTSRTLAKRVGVAPGLVSHYCPNMDALVADTFAAIVAGELEDVGRMVEQAAGPAARLGALLGTSLDRTRQDVTLVWVEAWALGLRNEVLAASVRAQMDAWQGVVQGLVEEGVAAGDFAVDDAAAAAWQLLGMLDGLNAQALVRWDGGSSRASLIGRAVEAMVGAQRGALGLDGVV